MTIRELNRRDFLGQSLGLIGAAGLLVPSALPGPLRAQAQGGAPGVRRPERYEDSLIFERKPTFSWPNGKTLAVWIIPNVEVWHFDVPGGPAVAGDPSSAPDVMNYAWREYGIRVGLWRIAEVMAGAGVRATVALNSAVCTVFPKAVEEMKRLGWEFMGHGITNSQSLRNLSLDQEKEVIQTTLRTIEQATGKKPQGWLGPGLGETLNTPDVLAEEGVLYVGDWNNDDQPYPMKVKKGSLTSIPYCMEINDIPLYRDRGHTAEQYLQVLTDQFETLYAESQKLPKVMGMPIHPYLTGQPLRIKYFKQGIAHIQKHEGVWFATGSEILEAYQRSQA